MSHYSGQEFIQLGIETNWRGEPVKTTTYHIEAMQKAGIEPYEFIQGYKDALTDNGFNGTHKDYIMGFKFAVTGKIDLKKPENEQNTQTSGED